MKLSEVLNLDVKALEKRNEKRREDLRQRMDAIRNSGDELIANGPNKDKKLKEAEVPFWSEVLKQLDKITKSLPLTIRKKAFIADGEQILQIARAVDDRLKGVDHKLRAEKTQAPPQTQQPQNQPTTTPTTSQPLDENERKSLGERADKFQKVPEVQGGIYSIKELLKSAVTSDDLQKIEKWIKQIEESYSARLPDPTSDLGKQIAEGERLTKEFEKLEDQIRDAKGKYPSRFSSLVNHENAFRQATRIVGAQGQGVSQNALDTAKDELAEIKKLLLPPVFPPQNTFELCRPAIETINMQLDEIRKLPLTLLKVMQKEKDVGEVCGVVTKEVQTAVAPLASLTKIIAETFPFYATTTTDNECKIERNVSVARDAVVKCKNAITKSGLFTTWSSIPASLSTNKNVTKTIETNLDTIEKALK